MIVVVLGSGCTSLLGTGTLRDGRWSDEQAGQTETPAGEPSAAEPEAEAVAEDSAAAESGAADADRRAAAIEEAVSRLARAGRLDDEARAVLVETLERTEPEDWPVVVEAFTESLPPPRPAIAPVEAAESAAVAPVPAGDDPPPAPHTVAKAALDPAAPAAPEPEPREAPEPPATEAAHGTDPEAQARSTGSAPDVESVTVPPAAEPPVVLQAAAPGAPPASSPPQPRRPDPRDLVIRNTCFATRVQAWGVVDRFPADRFHPGQELIVYFELDNLSAGETAAGHTTCIDSSLDLLGPGEATVHTWQFEPIAETCQARRRDYFARYVVRIPEGVAPGAFRLAVTVTDTLSGSRASASLPLEILAPAD